MNEIRQAENMNVISGLDVINVGLGAVLYDTDTGQYFVPNTGETALLQKEDDMILGHEMEQEFEESGNSSV